MSKPKMVQISFADAALLRAEGLTPYSDTGRMFFVEKDSAEFCRLQELGRTSPEELALEREVLLDANELLAETKRKKRP